MKQYMTNAINSSPTVTFPAAADMENPSGKAVKLNSSGEVVISDTKGEAVLGIVTIDNDSIVAKGDPVSIQIKDIGAALIKDAAAAGDELTSAGDGSLTKAAAGNHVIGVAVSECTAGTMGRIQIAKYKI